MKRREPVGEKAVGSLTEGATLVHAADPPDAPEGVERWYLVPKTPKSEA